MKIFILLIILLTLPVLAVAGTNGISDTKENRIMKDPVLQINALQEEIAVKQKQLLELKRGLLPEPVADMTLLSMSGPVKLSSLFSTTDSLLVIHNMGRGCPYCTLWADGLNSQLPYLSTRMNIVLVSPDPAETQQEFARDRGWKFPLLSDSDGTFSTALGFRMELNGQTMLTPGFSILVKKEDDTIERVARDEFGPGDVYCPVWHIFDLLPDGVGNWQPNFNR